MNYDNIKQSLHRVLSLIEDCEREGLSAVEYDLIIKELRDVYSAFRFGFAPAAAETQNLYAESAHEHEAVPAQHSDAEPEVVTESVQATVAEEVIEESAPETPEETAAAFFKSEDEGQSRRMFLRSLYDGYAPEPENKQEEQPAAEPINETPVEETAAPAEEFEAAVEETAAEDSREDSPEPAEEPVVETEVVAEPQPEPQQPAVGHTSEAETAPATEHHFTPEHTEAVLGEMINADVRTIADTIVHEDAVADVVGKEAISDLRQAIGINDRFLLIRDLFEGNAEAFESTVAKLNSFDNLDDCMIYIVENYDWNPYCDGAKLLMSLIERRYMHHA